MDSEERRDLGEARTAKLSATLFAKTEARATPAGAPMASPARPSAPPAHGGPGGGAAPWMSATQGDARGARAPAVTAGTTIQHYEVIRQLGYGGMGAVFLARDTRLGRLVALKLLRGESGGPATRFHLEALATAQMTHENIVVIHELGEHLGAPYMVLEYLKGKTLDEVLRERQRPAPEDPGPGAGASAAALPADRAVELIIPVVRALVCAHARGVVHRDLKPSNIMVTDAGAVKVLDFGIAKWMHEPRGEGEGAPGGGGLREAAALGLTGDGMMIGTAPYMSPEQWGAGDVDHRTDIWAVGVVLAELLLGRHPLAPLTVSALSTIGRLHVPMPSLRELRPELGKLGSIVDRCLLKRRDDRLGSASELLGELEALSPARARGRASADEKQNPFAGLSAFQERDAARYFGRTRAVMEVVARLAAQPLIAVVGPSGAGKSSFVRAGVIPALDRTGEAFQSLTVRPGRCPLAALAELLLASPVETQLARDARDGRDGEGREALVAALREAPGLLGAELRVRARRKQKRLLLFVDQFEELYTLAPEEERAAFLACIAGVADDAGSPLRVVLALRSDFLGRVTEAEAAQIGLDRGIVPLSPMNRDGLRDALLRPLEAVDHRFEHPGMVEEMLTTLEHTASALPLLSFTAARLWEERDRGRRVLTAASYQRIGGVAGTLAGHAEATLEAMSPEERKLARTALLRLVTPERTRALCSRGELCALGASPAAMERVLGRLVDARLLTVESSGEADATVELVHESLIETFPTLSRWITEHQEDAAFLARLGHAAREWEASGRSEDLLWRGQAAEASARWRAQYTGDLAPAEERYLEAVRGLAERRRRLRRWGITGVFAALSVIAAAGVYLALRAERAAALARTEAARAEQQAARADEEASLEQAKAAQARNASRVAAAREWQSDPTTVLALLREVEPPEVPRGWGELTYAALRAPIAEAVLAHAQFIYDATWSPDGARIITAGYDHVARIWSADGSGEPLLLRGHSGAVRSAAWSPDGRRVVTASEDGTARVWSADGTGAPLVLRDHAGAVRSAAWSPDGRRVVTASEDGTARFWSADGAGELLVLRGHRERINAAAWSPDGSRIVTASADGTARVWSADGRGAPRVLRGHQGPVHAAAWSPDSSRIVTGSEDRTARVWSADGAGEPLVFRGHQDVIFSVQFSPDGERVASASRDRTAQVWNADGTGEPVALRGHRDWTFSAAWSPDGKRIVTASLDKAARVWKADGKAEPQVFRGHKDIVYAAAWSPDGARVITASYDRTARVWNADGTGAPRVLRGHEGKVFSAEISPDGRRIVTASLDTTARVWSADGSGAPRILRGHEGAVTRAAWSPDGKRVATASWDRTVRVWNADGAGEPRVLRGHEDRIYWVAWSPDGEHVISASEDRTARVWRADGAGEPRVLRGHEEGVNAAAWSPDGKWIATAAWDKTARIWRADGTGEPRVLQGHQDWVNCAAWSPDGKWLATAASDSTVRVWDVEGASPPLVFRAGNRVTTASWSPDGRSIVAASGDGTALVWTDVKELRGVDDPTLWTATTYCMSVEARTELLNLPEATAHAHQQACLRRVEEARGAGRAGEAGDRRVLSR